MALAFLKTVYDWTTGNDMPDDLRKRQESMERRQEQRNTVIRPLTKRDISKVPSIPTFGDEEISDDDEKKMLRDKQQQQQRQRQSQSPNNQKASSERKSSSKGFDSIMDVQRRSFVGDLMPVAGSCVDENDDENPSIEMKNKSQKKTRAADFSDDDDDDDEEEQEDGQQQQKRRQQEHDDEASNQTNQQELSTLKEIVAGGSKNIDSTWTERPRTYKWIEEKQKKLEVEHKKAESAGKSVKDMANEQVLAPALRLRADAAKKLQRGKNNNNNQETKSSSSPPHLQLRPSSPAPSVEDARHQKLLHAQKRAQVARQLQIKLKNFADEKNTSSKKVAHDGEDDDFLKGIEEEGRVDSSQRNNTGSSNDDEDEVSQKNANNKNTTVTQKTAFGIRKEDRDDVFAIEDDGDQDSLHFSSDADSEN